MQRSAPFSRFHMIMSAVAGLMGSVASGEHMSRDAALMQVGGYESRGHGGKTPRRKSGILGVQRAALKKRNQRRNRVAHRG